MSTLFLRNISMDMKKWLRIKAALADTSMEYQVRLILGRAMEEETGRSAIEENIFDGITSDQLMRKHPVTGILMNEEIK